MYFLITHRFDTGLQRNNDSPVIEYSVIQNLVYWPTTYRREYTVTTKPHPQPSRRLTYSVSKDENTNTYSILKWDFTCCSSPTYFVARKKPGCIVISTRGHGVNITRYTVIPSPLGIKGHVLVKSPHPRTIIRTQEIEGGEAREAFDVGIFLSQLESEDEWDDIPARQMIDGACTVSSGKVIHGFGDNMWGRVGMLKTLFDAAAVAV